MNVCSTQAAPQGPNFLLFLYKRQRLLQFQRSNAAKAEPFGMPIAKEQGMLQ